MGQSHGACDCTNEVLMEDGTKQRVTKAQRAAGLNSARLKLQNQFNNYRPEGTWHGEEKAEEQQCTRRSRSRSRSLSRQRRESSRDRPMEPAAAKLVPAAKKRPPTVSPSSRKKPRLPIILSPNKEFLDSLLYTSRSPRD